MWSTKYFVVSVESSCNPAVSCMRMGPLRRNARLHPQSRDDVCTRCACVCIHKHSSTYGSEVIARAQTYIPTNVCRSICYWATIGHIGCRHMPTRTLATPLLLSCKCVCVCAAVWACVYTQQCFRSCTDVFACVRSP